MEKYIGRKVKVIGNTEHVDIINYLIGQTGILTGKFVGIRIKDLEVKFTNLSKEIQEYIDTYEGGTMFIIENDLEFI